jgi:hypothetical protein
LIANEVIVLAKNSEAVGGSVPTVFRVEKIGAKVPFVLVFFIGGECLKSVVIAISISLSESNASRSGDFPKWVLFYLCHGQRTQVVTG